VTAPRSHTRRPACATSACAAKICRASGAASMHNITNARCRATAALGNDTGIAGICTVEPRTAAGRTAGTTGTDRIDYVVPRRKREIGDLRIVATGTTARATADALNGVIVVVPVDRDLPACAGPEENDN